MNESEQTEYMGLAAAVGRLAVALKNTEAALAEAIRERDELKARLDPAEEPSSTPTIRSTG